MVSRSRVGGNDPEGPGGAGQKVGTAEGGVQARRALLEGILDYAGLFPPAALPLEEAAREYGALRRHEHAWMLGRFVVPAGRLANLDPPEGWPLVVLFTSAALAAEIAAARAFRERRPDCPFEAFELALQGAPLEPCLAQVPSGISTFCEPGWEGDMAGRVGELARLRRQGRPVGLKLRTGGVRAEHHPEPPLLATALARAASEDVPVKFTAGLHQPVRHEAPEIRCRQFGFLGVLLAAMLAREGAPAEELVQILEEERVEAFHANGTFGRGARRLSADRVRELRGEVVGFGSCSFLEPLEALERAGWLAPTGGGGDA